eukprot:s6652_g4.t1
MPWAPIGVRGDTGACSRSLDWEEADVPSDAGVACADCHRHRAWEFDVPAATGHLICAACACGRRPRPGGAAAGAATTAAAPSRALWTTTVRVLAAARPATGRPTLAHELLALRAGAPSSFRPQTRSTLGTNQLSPANSPSPVMMYRSPCRSSLSQPHGVARGDAVVAEADVGAAPHLSPDAPAQPNAPCTPRTVAETPVDAATVGMRLGLELLDRTGLQQAVEERCPEAVVSGWKLFFLAPRMLLHREPGQSCDPRARTPCRGLPPQGVADPADPPPRRLPDTRIVHRPAVAGAPCAPAEALVHLGEFSAASRSLTTEPLVAGDRRDHSR